MVRQTYESARHSQTVLLVIGLVVGLLLILFSYESTFVIETWWQTETFPAFVLGVLMIVATSVGLAALSRRIIVVEKDTRRVCITDRYFGRQTERTIDFADIESVRLSQFGLTWGERRFDVVLECRDGRSVSLFSSAYFPGSFVRSQIERYRSEIEHSIFGT